MWFHSEKDAIMEQFRIRIVDTLLRDTYVIVEAESYDDVWKEFKHIIDASHGSLTELERLLGVSLQECRHTITLDDITCLGDTIMFGGKGK